MESICRNTLVSAYSYLRFSSPDQRAGDSIRRQTSLAIAYAEEFGLKLDENLTYRDFGISGFRGENASSGRLGDFLTAVSAGLVPVGSVLLVENLDRLSRDSALHAQNLLTQIVLAGVSVVTLSDRRTYSVEELRRDPMGLIFALINFIRANEENELKSSRAKANWVTKRSTALAKPLTAKCPVWLMLDKGSGKFVEVPNRVQAVRRIFNLVDEGRTFTAIAETLNREKAPTPQANIAWTRHAVSTIVGFSAVVGTYVPHYQAFENGRSVRRPLKPIPNYYPPIVTNEQFARAQACRMAAYTSGRSTVGYLLQNLAKCAICNQYMKIVRRAENGPSMVCAAAVAGMADHYKEVPYLPIDAILRQTLPEILSSFSYESARYGTSTRLITAQNGVDRARRAIKHRGQSSRGIEEMDHARSTLVAAEEEMRDAAENYQSRPSFAAIRQVSTALECLADGVLTVRSALLVNRALVTMFSDAKITGTPAILEMREVGGFIHRLPIYNAPNLA